MEKAFVNEYCYVRNTYKLPQYYGNINTDDNFMGYFIGIDVDACDKDDYCRKTNIIVSDKYLSLNEATYLMLNYRSYKKINCHLDQRKQVTTLGHFTPKTSYINIIIITTLVISLISIMLLLSIYFIISNEYLEVFTYTIAVGIFLIASIFVISSLAITLITDSMYYQYKDGQYHVQNGVFRDSIYYGSIYITKTNAKCLVNNISVINTDIPLLENNVLTVNHNKRYQLSYNVNLCDIDGTCNNVVITPKRKYSYNQIFKKLYDVYLKINAVHIETLPGGIIYSNNTFIDCYSFNNDNQMSYHLGKFKLCYQYFKIDWIISFIVILPIAIGIIAVLIFASLSLIVILSNIHFEFELPIHENLPPTFIQKNIIHENLPSTFIQKNIISDKSENIHLLTDNKQGEY